MGAMTARLPNRLVSDSFTRIREGVRDVVTGLEQEALAYRPDRGANSIAWLVWHLTRQQDVQVAAITRTLHRPAAQQVWTEAGWYDTFNLPFPAQEHGYGQDPVEAARVIAGARVLAGYADDVHARTLAIIGQLGKNDYDEVIDRSFDPPVTVAVRLVSIVDDAARHLGQAEYVRGLYERLS